MAGYWPSSVFFVFMDQDEVEVHKLAKKERGQYPAIFTEQTWSIKDLSSFGEIFLVGRGEQSRAGKMANHSAEFDYLAH